MLLVSLTSVFLSDEKENKTGNLKPDLVRRIFKKGLVLCSRTIVHPVNLLLDDSLACPLDTFVLH